MSRPKVSVIIPTCNRPAFLPTAIRSVLDQTFSEFELIVVDDASDEPIASLVQAFHDDRVRWMRHDRRRGAAAARNTGIRNSDGEFVAFLDDDDEWYPEKLRRQVAVLFRSPPDVGAVYTGYDVVDRNAGKILSRMQPIHKGDISSALLRDNCIGSTSCILLRRTCLESAGMFDETLPAFQDYDLWIRLSKMCSFEYVSECLLRYHLHSSRIWTDPERICNGLNILLRKHGISRPLRRQCSAYYFSAAVQFCEASQGRKARAALRRAIGLYPFAGRYYLYFLLSLMNGRAYQSVQQTKAKVLGRPVRLLGKTY